LGFCRECEFKEQKQEANEAATPREIPDKTLESIFWLRNLPMPKRKTEDVFSYQCLYAADAAKKVRDKDQRTGLSIGGPGLTIWIGLRIGSSVSRKKGFF
jgi:hypothetical protein